MEMQDRIRTSLNKAFLDDNISIDEGVRTRFLVNDQTKRLTVLESIQTELKKCKTFTFSVAFITESGLNELKAILFDLDRKGISGRIITSNYLSFNSPKVFKELLKIKNVEVRVTDSVGYHAKGYLFDQEGYSTLIMGSSNLTSHALKVNHEWNLKISSLIEGEIIKEIQNTINKTWDEAEPLSESWIKKYEATYVDPKILNSNNYTEENGRETYLNPIIPNKMQTAALRGIEDVRSKGESKALLVSATGTGKTYLSAFDVRNVKPKRFLFIVHREQILRESIKSFQRVLDNDSSEYGLLTGTSKDFDAKYLFTTIQSLSTDSNLSHFNKDDFDYIVIDEVHKSGAPSYIKVMEYFEPKFMLGMTATPERTDDVNIYKFFDYNIAYEIRLKDAIEESLICPFHYFGVTSYEKDGLEIDEVSDLRNLVSIERVDYLVEKINYYGHSGNDVKGLIFVSRVEEADEISIMLNERGFKTTSLSGSHSHAEREEAILNLERGNLDYIITVDIFNEGIDIPFINQVIMLRETQSSIIFTQQLGRGLRLHKDKDFVTVIDFIGNYKNNYMIPIALSGDISLNADILRKNIIDTSYISGVSGVNFEEVAKERIFESIATAKLDSISNLRKEYIALKNKIGRTPNLSDFYINKSIDPMIIGTKKDSYYSFIKQYDKDFNEQESQVIPEEGVKVLELISKEILNGKRTHEALLLKHLMKHGSISDKELEQLYITKEIYFTGKTIDSVLAMLNLDFYIITTRNRYSSFPLVIVESNIISLSEPLQDLLQLELFKNMFTDTLDTSLLISEKYDDKHRFTIGELYTRKDASRLLEWGKDISGTIFGYSVREGECPIFVTYNKVDVEDSIAYEDGFINTNTFRWYSRNKTTTETQEVKDIIESVEKDIELSLFVKKDDSTYKSNFYYLGRMVPIKESVENEIMENGQSVVRIDMKLETPLDENFYHYLTD